MMMTAWRRVSAAVFAIVLGLTFAACAPQQEQMDLATYVKMQTDSYVSHAHPNARQISKIGVDGDDSRQVYILCEGGSVRVVMTRFSRDPKIVTDIELDRNHVNCTDNGSGRAQ